MYFASRQQAGRTLAGRLTGKYRYRNCAVVAIDDGGAMVGAQIAAELHCVLTLLMVSDIHLPLHAVESAATAPTEIELFNDRYSAGFDEDAGEHYSPEEQDMLQRVRGMNHLYGNVNPYHRRFLREHDVILVTDGLPSGFPIDMIAEFLKPVSVSSLVVATPIASVSAVDRMHILADDLYCLDTTSNYIDTDHYYGTRDVPDHKTVLGVIENIVLHWK